MAFLKNQKLPMQSHKLPDRPWSRVAEDQFKLHSQDYIVLVDLYSDFIEVKKSEENTSSSVVEFVKEQFSRYGCYYFFGCPVPGLPIGLFECRNHVLGGSAMLFC